MTWDRSPFFRALRFTRPRADPVDLDLNVSFHDQDLTINKKFMITRFKLNVTIRCVVLRFDVIRFNDMDYDQTL